jgi:general stress protein 26
MNLARSAAAMLPALMLAVCVLTFSGDAWGQGAEAVESPRDTLLAAARNIMEMTRFCVLITLDESGHPRARTMDPFLPDEDMVVWMGTFRATRKVRDIRNDPRVTLYYAHPENAGYVCLYGTARIVDDPAMKEKWWKDEWEQIYPQRETDFILIAVKPERLEVIDYSRGIKGDPNTWAPPSLEF